MQQLINEVLKTTTPKTNTVTGGKKSTNKKTKAKVSTKPVAKVAAPVFGLTAGSTYPGKSNVMRRSFTLAALVAAGIINVSPKAGLVSKGKTPHANMFKKITASKARPWNPMLKDQGAIVLKAQSAIKGQASNGFNGQVALINKMVAFIAKGGTRTFKDENGVEESITLTAR